MPVSPTRLDLPLRGKFYFMLLTAATIGTWAGCSCSREAPDASGGGGDSASRQVVALGAIEPRDGIIDVTGIVGDRIAELKVVAGQEVQRGDVLAVFESQSLRQIELQSVEARLSEATAQRAAGLQVAAARIARAELAVKQANQVQQDLEVLGKKVGVAATNSELAQKQRAQLISLPARLVSEQKRDGQMLLVEKANLELVAAQAEFERARRDGEFQRQAADAELAAAQAAQAQVVASIPLESLQAARELAEEQLARTQLLASSDGTVLQIFRAPGETVGQTPLLQLANLKQMVVVAEMYESDVKRLRVGQKATVRSNAFRAPYDEQGLRGTVEQIGRVVSSPVRTSLDPFAPADRHVVEARILLDAEDARQAAEFVGLQVEVALGDTDKRE